MPGSSPCCAEDRCEGRPWAVPDCVWLACPRLADCCRWTASACRVQGPQLGALCELASAGQHQLTAAPASPAQCWRPVAIQAAQLPGCGWLHRPLQVRQGSHEQMQSQVPSLHLVPKSAGCTASSAACCMLLPLSKWQSKGWVPGRPGRAGEQSGGSAPVHPGCMRAPSRELPGLCTAVRVTSKAPLHAPTATQKHAGHLAESPWG